MYCEITSTASGLCLSAMGSDPGDAVVLARCAGTAEQWWTTDYHSKYGTELVLDAGYNLVLSMPGRSQPGEVAYANHAREQAWSRR